MGLRGTVFTIACGDEVQVAVIQALRNHLLGRGLEAPLPDMGGLCRQLVHDSQLRWLGSEKGVMHMATGAVVNALRDLKAKREGKPLWQLLASMAPEQVVDLVDFPYLVTDALANRGMIEQFLQADALSALQIDTTRVAGVDENLTMLLLAAKFVDHLHEHFVTPVDVCDGQYRPPLLPGAGTKMLAASPTAHAVSADG